MTRQGVAWQAGSLIPALGMAALGLSGCATMPKLYSEDELSTVGRACGLAEGELVQEADEPRLVFLFRPQPSQAQVGCVKKWTRKHRLTLALIDVNWTNN